MKKENKDLFKAPDTHLRLKKICLPSWQALKGWSLPNHFQLTFSQAPAAHHGRPSSQGDGGGRWVSLLPVTPGSSTPHPKPRFHCYENGRSLPAPPSCAPVTSLAPGGAHPGGDRTSSLSAGSTRPMRSSAGVMEATARAVGERWHLKVFDRFKTDRKTTGRIGESCRFYDWWNNYCSSKWNLPFLFKYFNAFFFFPKINTKQQYQVFLPCQQWSHNPNAGCWNTASLSL